MPATYCACHILCLPHAKVKKKSGEILLTAKAFNGRVIVMWLNNCLLDALQSNPDHEMLILTSVAMNLGGCMIYTSAISVQLSMNVFSIKVNHQDIDGHRGI